MDDLTSMNRRLDAIEYRNKRVEADKQWETSTTRKVLLFAFTYIAIGLYMWVISVPKPWLNAVVPSVGFFLSTLTLPYFKEWWIKKNHQAMSRDKTLD
jgi:hypothetical protein